MVVLQVPQVGTLLLVYAVVVGVPLGTWVLGAVLRTAPWRRVADGR